MPFSDQPASNRLKFSFRCRALMLPPEILAAGSREGHWGMTGMHERAARIRGTFTIENDPSGGARIELRIPAAVAYRLTSRGTRRLVPPFRIAAEVPSNRTHGIPLMRAPSLFIATTILSSPLCNEQIAFHLNGNNLFDQVYYTRLGATNAYNTFGTPRNYALGVRATF